MSSGPATFFRPDGTVIGYGIYFGTADLLLPILADTPDSAWEARKTGREHPECTCGQPPEPVVILSEYGGQWWWEGEWCPRCRCIHGPCAPYACQVCHESPYYGERHECVRAETHEGRPAFPVPSAPSLTQAVSHSCITASRARTAFSCAWPLRVVTPHPA